MVCRKLFLTIFIFSHFLNIFEKYWFILFHNKLNHLVLELNTWFDMQQTRI